MIHSLLTLPSVPTIQTEFHSQNTPRMPPTNVPRKAMNLFVVSKIVTFVSSLNALLRLGLNGNEDRLAEDNCVEVVTGGETITR